MPMDQDKIYMQKACSLALKGVGGVNPNPLVGAVIVKDGQIIGEGYHALYGGPHAEINAFADASHSVKGGTMYVTLEPCSHYGKTPPCAYEIVKKGIKKVVIGMLDPNPLVSGQGVRILEDAGLEVVHGVLEQELSQMNRVFLKYIKTRLPYVVMKTAMTLDGKIATSSGDSRWVSNSSSRYHVHKLRNELAGIMVGVDTVIADDPMLTTRLDGVTGRNPLRIVVDSKARIPLDARVLNTANEASTLLAVTREAPVSKLEQIRSMGNEVVVVSSRNGRVDLQELMRFVGEKEIDGVLLEGGGTLNFSALMEGVVDEVVSFISPKIVGGADAKTPVGGHGIDRMNSAIELEDIAISNLDEDIMMVGKVKKSYS